MSPESLFGMLSDPTRLRALMLLQAEGELCVCELTHALGESQPKVSRHLALLRDAGLVAARREGIWMHYRISNDLPVWAARIIANTLEQTAHLAPLARCQKQLERMPGRPEPRLCG